MNDRRKTRMSGIDTSHAVDMSAVLRDQQLARDRLSEEESKLIENQAIQQSLKVRICAYFLYNIYKIILYSIFSICGAFSLVL